MWNRVDSGADVPHLGRLILVRPGKNHGCEWCASASDDPVVARVAFDEDEGYLYWACVNGVGEDIIAGDEWFYIPE